MSLPRMRLLDEAASELKILDPNTAVTKNCIRELALDGKIPTMIVGTRKRLINFDALLTYLENPPQDQQKSNHGIRAISEKMRM